MYTAQHWRDTKYSTVYLSFGLSFSRLKITVYQEYILKVVYVEQRAWLKQ